MHQKKILVIDWLDAYGGAERVAKYLDQVFVFDEVYTLVNIMDPNKIREIFTREHIKINTSFLQLLGKRFRYALPLFPLAIHSLRIKDKNALILSVSHSVAKGIPFDPSSKHISYLVARNLKYVWEEKPLYFYGIRKFFLFTIPYLRNFDIQASKKPDKLISTSRFVSKWAKEKYNIDSGVIYSPVDIDKFTFQEKKSDNYITVGRLEPYKRFDILIDAFNRSKRKLIVIGDGSQRRELERRSESNIEFKGYVETSEINTYLKSAKGFVFTGKEDFGIALIESQVCGTPVISFSAGGALESVIDNRTGVLFKEQTWQSLNTAIDKFEKTGFDPNEIRKHALQFSVENFKDAFKEEVYGKGKLRYVEK